MANLILGLDIGPNSIGWSLIDQEAGKIHAAGVRVFPEGVDRDQQGCEKSKSQSRRDARAIRRQIQRRVRRRRLLREELGKAGLLPQDSASLEKLLAANPYELRGRAVKEKVSLFELGRIILHLGQRRGYKSNRKADKAQEKENKGILAEMNDLAGKIQAAGEATLGSYFAELDRRYDRTRPESDKHIRRRHTKREMYEHEFDRIWEEQRKHYPDVLTDALKYGRRGRQLFPKKPEPLGKSTSLLAEYGIHGLLFFQRKIYWPKSVVGRCELEPREKRCPRAARIAQRFRMVQEVNNIMLLNRVTHEERSLSQSERDAVLQLLMQKKEVSFDEIRKKLKFGDAVRFNFERGGRNKLDGHKTDALLSGKKALDKRWKELPEEIKDRAVDILIEEDQEADAVRRLMAECEFAAEDAEKAAAIPMPDGYMSFSRSAMKKLLPFMEKGYMLMATDAANSAVHAAGYLRADEREINQRKFLPLPPQLTNPIVRQAAYEVRKVVNSILRELIYRGEHTLAAINVELAREAKKSFDERTEIRIDNFKRQRLRADAARWIEDFNPSIKPTRKTVNRYLLWQEQGEDCPYCGKKISPEQLFNGGADVDHILPRWRSLDDSLANQVVAHRACNQAKGDHTPRKWLEGDPERYDMVMKLAARLPFGKQRKFQQEDVELGDFVNRQLTDTAYITRCVSQYLRCLGAKVVCTRGQMTADLRHYWGLNTILHPEGEGEKTRNDHRHHAVDALVIALTDSKRLFALANARGKEIPMPWEGFREEAEKIVKEINVSHRALRKLRGALHEETFYGPTHKPPATNPPAEKEKRPWAKNWIEDPNAFVRRKPIESLTKTQDLEKVRDATIKEILRQHLRNLGVDPDAKSTLPKDAFKGANAPKMPSGVPIKKVRLIEPGEAMQMVSERRNNHYVKPGSNHHIVYYESIKKGKKIWTAEVITMWEATRRARRGLTVIDRSEKENKRFIMSLSIGEMFQVDAENGEKKLCVVKKISKADNRIYFKSPIDARKATEIDKENLYFSLKSMQERNACKVTIDRLGRIRRAND